MKLIIGIIAIIVSLFSLFSQSQTSQSTSQDTCKALQAQKETLNNDGIRKRAESRELWEKVDSLKYEMESVRRYHGTLFNEYFLHNEKSNQKAWEGVQKNWNKANKVKTELDKAKAAYDKTMNDLENNVEWNEIIQKMKDLGCS